LGLTHLLIYATIIKSKGYHKIQPQDTEIKMTIIHERTAKDGKQIKITLEITTDQHGYAHPKLTGTHGSAKIDGYLSQVHIRPEDRIKHAIPAEYTHTIGKVLVPASVANAVATARLECDALNIVARSAGERAASGKKIQVVSLENGGTEYRLLYVGMSGYGRCLEPAAVQTVLGNFAGRIHEPAGWHAAYPITLEEYEAIVARQAPDVTRIAEIAAASVAQPAPITPEVARLLKQYGSSDRAWESEDEGAWNTLRNAGF
jgi:hypothetical protein